MFRKCIHLKHPITACKYMAVGGGWCHRTPCGVCLYSAKSWGDCENIPVYEPKPDCINCICKFICWTNTKADYQYSTVSIFDNFSCSMCPDTLCKSQFGLK